MDIFENLPSAAMHLDAACRILKMNACARKLFSRYQADNHVSEFSELLISEDTAVFTDFLQKLTVDLPQSFSTTLLSTPETYIPITLLASLTAEGEYIFILQPQNVYTTGCGNKCRYAAVLEAQYQNNPGGILLVNGQMEMISFNQAFVRIWSIPPGILRSRDEEASLNYVLDQLADPAEFLARVRQLYQQQNETSRDEIYLRDGRTLYRHTYPIFSNDMYIGRVWYFLDITPLKQAEAKLLQIQKTESLARMAGAIAHNFNNQLTVVMGNLELFLDDLSGDGKNRANLLQSMMAAKKAAEVSRQMLSYLGQTSGKHQSINLSEVCRQSLIFLRAAIPKGLILNADFSSSGPIIRADAGQIQQVLANLITNAWESFPGNQGSIGLTIRTVVYGDIPLSRRAPFDWQPQHVPYACLEVSDTGSGISNKDIEKLFDPFFTTKFTGRGMGLSVVMGIVKSHGGCITVDSESGSGSVFRVFLPVSREKSPLLFEPETPATVPVREVENGSTVLLIEDEEMVRNMATTMLTRIGYMVIEAQDGVEALQIFQQYQDKIVCVLSDLTMPRMNGWETLTELRKLRADVPVILASGYDQKSVMADDYPEQPQVFLNKPYVMAALKEALEKAMSR